MGYLQEAGWDGTRIHEPQRPGVEKDQPFRRNEKAAPLLGPLFKEAERREVREDFARCRSAEQGD